MIHFRCGCGRTISVEDDRIGLEIRCVGCGRGVVVPGNLAVKAPVTGSDRSNRVHDFDAEIVSAARSVPPRPVKTPDNVVASKTVVKERGTKKASPAFGAVFPRGAVGFIPWIAVGGLLLSAAGAAGQILFDPGTVWVRVGVAVGLLSGGGAAAAALLVGGRILKTIRDLGGGEGTPSGEVSPRPERSGRRSPDGLPPSR